MHDIPNNSANNANTIVIYHGPKCWDGTAAAWFIRKVLPNATYFPAEHGQPAPDCTGKRVVMVDFSYKADVMKQIAAQATAVLVLDHHAGAEPVLRQVADECSNVMFKFDNNKSGATLALDLMRKEIEVSSRVERIAFNIQQTDIWKHTPGDEADCMFHFLNTRPSSFATMDYLEALSDTGFDTALVIGNSIIKYSDQQVQMAAKSAFQRPMPVPDGTAMAHVCNAPYFLASKLGHYLCRDGGFAVIWYQTDQGDYKLSFRSNGDIDVSAIAKLYGGSGHRAASGAVVAKLPWA